MENLIDALDYLMEVKREHDAAREKCEYDWDYFGGYHIDRLEAARSSFERAFNKAIDERIEERELEKNGFVKIEQQ